MIGPMRAATAEVRAALGLLTRLPIVGSADVGAGGPSAGLTPTRVAGTGASAFPLVGAALAAVAAIPFVALPARDAPIAAILSLAILTLADGALHLDGLADSVDALAAPSPEAAERARTDPRVGAAGATALILVLAADVVSLSLLAAADRGLVALVFIVGAAASRGTVALLAPWMPRRPDGFGAWFGAQTPPRSALLAGICLAIIVAVGGVVVPSGIVVLAGAGAIAVTALILAILGRRQGGATGDAYGAAIELGLATALVVAAVGRR